MLVHDVDFRPSAPAVRHLVETAELVTKKPAAADAKEVPGGRLGNDSTEWDASSVRAIAEEFRLTSRPGDVALRVLYLHGTYRNEGGEVAAGVAFESTIVLFPDMLAVTTPQHPFREAIERAVLVHEFGHLTGLVNLSIPMIVERATPDGVHSRHRESVMQPGVESARALLGMVAAREGIPDRFDEADILDIRTFQNG